MRQAVLGWFVVSLFVACDVKRAPISGERVDEGARTARTGFQPRCSAVAAPMPERDNAAMCWVPARRFRMGWQPDHPAQSLPRQVEITSGFYIDQYEVTIAQFAAFLADNGNECPGAPDGLCTIASWTERSELPHEKLSLPTMATFVGAEAYCAWVGKRLPTEAEWELAARVDPGSGAERVFPWGDAFEPGITNCAETVCSDGYALAAPVGSFPRDRSAIGALDMGGNEGEYVADCYRAAVESCSPTCVDPLVTTQCDRVCGLGPGARCGRGAVVRGGTMATTLPFLRATNRAHASAGAETGFRCAFTP